ncbi:beta-glucuronidase [Paenibacillus sp. PK3_47]|uniref:beta-glucuronidase n=1 Tax=Paenibacillus sp. PK3_47 TaxID=2072642 RepID=UPI00201E4D32|nr:beta-glucuronidase [Paenibacillus sp. PK3_47]UQZ35570.1 beta-glucuronidase [Paenibacillus sp. PK3_47]
MLFPKDTMTRELKDLSGIWRFKPDPANKGREEEWFKAPLPDTIPMPVPASYNDITQDAALRDHIGDVWYEQIFIVPRSWSGSRIMLWVGSACHHAVVWVNGVEAAKHKGGFLPFEADISDAVMYGAENRVTIVVNNVLDWQTLPPGRIKTFDDEKHPEGYRVQEYFHDFFNYAGLHRPVKLYRTSALYIKDITITADVQDGTGIVHYEVEGSLPEAEVRVRLLDEDGLEVAAGKGISGELHVEKARLWRPLQAYLYTFHAELMGPDGIAADHYQLQTGIRTVKVEGTRFLINGEPFYFKGFGKHEDSDIRGKGLDQAVNVKDMNLLRWMNANSFRTSHYPYAEELLDLADREGIVVIGEVPAVGFTFFNYNEKVYTPDKANDETLAHHLEVLTDLIARDKNHPSVVMWSLANEAANFQEEAVPYFRRLADTARRLDPHRPITIVQWPLPDKCKVSQFFDVICVNRYYSWYQDPGALELVEQQVEWELKGWFRRFGKPVIMSEYGADAIAGFHQDPPVMFTEEYQRELLIRYHHVFDRLDFVIGEHVWAFADFATKQGITRVGGNRKGVFTRQRQPKAAAHMLRSRWGEMGDYPEKSAGEPKEE